MILLKSLMYIFLTTFYFLNTKKIDFLYLLFISLIMMSDLYGIQADNISIPISLFFISNIILTYLIISITKRNNKVLKAYKHLNLCTYIIIGIYIVFIYFDSTLMYVIGLALSLILLLYTSYIYYSKLVRTSSFLLLAGVGLLIITYIFTGLNQLVIPYKYFSLIDATAYAMALYFICRAVITSEKEFIENLEIIE